MVGYFFTVEIILFTGFDMKMNRWPGSSCPNLKRTPWNLGSLASGRFETAAFGSLTAARGAHLCRNPNLLDPTLEWAPPLNGAPVSSQKSTVHRFSAKQVPCAAAAVANDAAEFVIHRHRHTAFGSVGG